MALDIIFKIDKTDLLYQEDALFTFALTNSGAKPVQIRNPKIEHSTLQLRVINVKTGVQTLYRKPVPGGAMPLREEPLAPRATVDAALSLLWLAPLEPGDYEISAIFLYTKETEQTESAAVKVKVRPTTPAGLVLDSVQTTVLHAFWVNVGGDSPELVRTRLDILPGGGVGDLLHVGPVGLRTSPVASKGPNMAVVNCHWLAWLEGKSLKFQHIDKKLGASALKSVDLPFKEAKIVAPLSSSVQTNINIRPSGAVLVWMGDREQRISQLLSIPLNPDGTGQASKADLPGPAPMWLGSFQRTDKKKIALVVQAASGMVSLSEVPWPDTPGAVVRKLGEWKGEFVAAGMTLGFDDVLHGSIFVRTGVEAHQDLERIDFAEDPKGAFTSKVVGRITADPDDAFTKAFVRVSESGLVVALLQTFKGNWVLYDGKSPAALPPLVAKSPFPLDVAFMGGKKPILVVGGKDAGLKLMNPDGSPLPND
jgi:hypothetical protein